MTSERDEALGRILRRFITEDEPGRDHPPYLAVSNARLTLDGTVAITPAECELIADVLRA